MSANKKVNKDGLPLGRALTTEEVRMYNLKMRNASKSETKAKTKK